MTDIDLTDHIDSYTTAMQELQKVSHATKHQSILARTPSYSFSVWSEGSTVQENINGIMPSPSNPGSARKSLAKLNAEIAKLKAMKAFTEADLEEKLDSQRETMEAMIEETQIELGKSQEEYKSVRAEIVSKEKGINRVQRFHEDVEEELKETEEKNEELYTELNDITKYRNDWKACTDAIDGRMAIVLESLNEMLESQEKIAKAAKEAELVSKKNSDSRMEALYKILEEEGERRKQLTEVKKMGNSSVDEAIEKQKTYLKSVCESMKGAGESNLLVPIEINLVDYS